MVLKKQLYWVTDPDNFENWFIIAKDHIEAKERYASAEGMSPTYLKARLICEIPPKLISSELNHACWPDNKLLIALGFEFISLEFPRILKKGRVIYREGGASVAIALSALSREFGLYIINQHQSGYYKIGITKNLNRRLKQLQTGNPGKFNPVYFVTLDEPRKLENLLHFYWFKKRIHGDWFLLDKTDLDAMPMIIYFNFPESAFLDFRLLNWG